MGSKLFEMSFTFFNVTRDADQIDLTQEYAQPKLYLCRRADFHLRYFGKLRVKNEE